MKWHHYLMLFFGGAFLANSVPHFVSGVTGLPFPTPFADPPGRGLSTPVINVVWALFNLIVAYLLLGYGRFAIRPRISLPTGVAFIGFCIMALILAVTFTSVPR